MVDTDAICDFGGTLGTLRPGLPKPDSMLLRLQLIGRMKALTLNNQDVIPLGRKTRGLLAILAMSGRRPVLRSKLAELLWSRRSEEQARASLRQEIHRLLDALSPVGADVITVERHTLALRPALTSVDAERILNANPNQAETLPPVEGVLLDELTGTDPALDIWLETERTRLREHAIGLFESMLRRQRDTAGRLAAARQLLLLDGLHEGAWRAQIQGQQALGETGLALQSAERCAAAFTARHGAEPGPDTRRLLAELRGGSLASGSVDLADPLTDPAPQPLQATASQSQAAQQSTLAAPPPVRLAEGSDQLRPSTADGLPFVALLPLLELGGATDGAALTRGLVDNLGAELIRHDGMRLLQGSELQESLAQGRDDAVLRRRFGVDYVLDGTLQNTGGRLRVILRLTDIRQYGQVVWAQRFDAAEPDALTLQDSIAIQVVSRLAWEILLVESRRGSHRPIAELKPHAMALRAFASILRIDHAQSDTAVTLLRQAAALEPDHLLPHLVGALGHLLRWMQRWGDPADEAAAARRSVAAALSGVSGGGIAMSLCCLIRSEIDDEPEAALTLIERALERQPYASTAWAAAVFPLVRLGRLEQAMEHVTRYKLLYPTHPLEMLLDQTSIMIPLLQGRYDEAARTGVVLSELRPGFAANLVPYLASLGHLRRIGEAERIRTRLQIVRPTDGIASLVQAAGLRSAEGRDRLSEGLRLAGLPD